MECVEGCSRYSRRKEGETVVRVLVLGTTAGPCLEATALLVLGDCSCATHGTLWLAFSMARASSAGVCHRARQLGAALPPEVIVELGTQVVMAQASASAYPCHASRWRLPVLTSLVSALDCL